MAKQRKQERMQWKSLLSDQRAGIEYEFPKNAEKYIDRKYDRNAFVKDYSTIINSASYRRLQDKTQVFPLDKSDFVRTRLTHSHETSTIAKQLGAMIMPLIPEKEGKDEDPAFKELVSTIPDILMCAGLLHDIGNPPFGHFGEEVIRQWFRTHLHDGSLITGPALAAFQKYVPDAEKRNATLYDILSDQQRQDFLYFEGNAQALRLIGKLHFLNNDYGMNLTYAVLNSIIKYPVSSLGILKNKEDKQYQYSKKKLGYFTADTALYNAITEHTGAKHARHPLAYLLEAADDIAYLTADLEDGFKKGLFSLDQLQAFIDKQLKEYLPAHCDDSDTLEKVQGVFENLRLARERLETEQSPIIKRIRDKDLFVVQNWVRYVQGWLCYCGFYGFLTKYEDIMRGDYAYDLLHGTYHQHTMEILTAVSLEFIYPNRQILKLELAAETILSSLLDKFIPAIINFDPDGKPQKGAYGKLEQLISDNYMETYQLESRAPNADGSAKTEADKLYLRLLLVTDFICGMTDSYAKSLYQELHGIY